MGDIAGFDLASFNASHERQLVGGLEHIAATDMYGRQGARLLSEPVALTFDFVKAALPPPVDARTVHAVASADGVLNCVTWWYDLELGDGEPPLRLGPNLEAPTPFEGRARRQQVYYVGYERQLRRGERVAIYAEHVETALRVDAPVDEAAWRRGASAGLRVILLAYHFPMLADERRNGCFDRALVAPSAASRAATTAGRRVCSTSARAPGCWRCRKARGRSHALARDGTGVAQAARHAVAANGHAGVTVHTMMSTELEPLRRGRRSPRVRDRRRPVAR